MASPSHLCFTTVLADVEDGACLEARTARGETPLHYALWLGSELAVVGTLLGEGTEVNAVTADGRTPLHFAAASEQYQALVLLLRRGAEVDAVDNDGSTPLHVAAEANASLSALALPAATSMVAWGGGGEGGGGRDGGGEGGGGSGEGGGVGFRG